MNYQLQSSEIKLDDSQTNLFDTLIGLNLSRFVPMIADCSFVVEEKHSNVQGNHINITCNLQTHDKQQYQLAVNEKNVDTAMRAIIEKVKRQLERRLKSKQVLKPAAQMNSSLCRRRLSFLRVFSLLFLRCLLLEHQTQHLR